MSAANNPAPLRWGILGTGNIAHSFARGLADSRTGRLAAIGSRSQESAERFGDEFGASRRHASYEALLADAEVDVVYVSLPHPLHAEWTIRCAEAGKHVLCEKPAAINQRDALAMIDAARRHDVFFMEAFMYRCHAQTQRLAQLVREGALGEVRSIQAAFSFDAPLDPASRLFNGALGGGGILDVGCYPVSIARLIAGAAGGQAFAEPTELRALGRLGSTGIDEWTSAVARFPGDIVAELATGVRVQQDNTVRVYGSEGWIHLTNPWQPSRNGGAWSFLLHRRGTGKPEPVTGDEPRSLYAVEADTVAENLARRQAPAMTWDDTLGNMRVLDRWREEIGLRYPADE